MKKMNLLSSISLIALSALSLTALGQNTELKGQLKGLNDGIVKLTYKKNGVFKTDTVKAINDVFIWKINLEEPMAVGFQAGRNGYSLFMGPGHMTLTGVKDSSDSFKLTGSPMQTDATAFADNIKDLNEEQNAVYKGYSTASKEEKAVIDKKTEEIRNKKANRTVQFITDHPKSYFSIYLIAARASFGTDYKDVKFLYDKLDGSILKTVSGKKLTESLELLKKSRIGTQMTDFTQADTSGNPVKFSSFKGKYILVDFWASWCGPCRAENPNVLKIYNEFKAKGFTVVGVSLDDKAANWKKAIRDDKMPWVQLSDLKGWKNEVSSSFGIQGIPSNLLVDPSGKILAIDLRGPMLEMKLKQLLN